MSAIRTAINGLLLTSIVLTSCRGRESAPMPIPTEWTPTMMPSPAAELGFPDELGAQTELLTRQWYEADVAERVTFWNGPMAEQLYRLSHYDDLSRDPIERNKQLEPIINTPWIFTVVIGLDGQSTIESQGQKGRTQEIDKANADAPIFHFFNVLTGQSIVLCPDRSLTLPRGIDFQGDGDVLNRINLTSSPEFRVLGADDPIENIELTLAIATGMRPDHVVLADMDGFRNLAKTLFPDQNPEEELKTIRDRSKSPAGDRSYKAAKMLISLMRSQVERGIPLTNNLHTGTLDIAEFVMGLMPDNIHFDESGNPLALFTPALREQELDDEQTKAFVDGIAANVIFLRLTDANVPLIETESGYKDYDPEALLAQVAAEMERERDMGNPDDHAYAILAGTKSRETGHQEMTMIPIVVDQNAVASINWKLPHLGVDYDMAVTDDAELVRLMEFWALFRTILSRYVTE